MISSTAIRAISVMTILLCALPAHSEQTAPPTPKDPQAFADSIAKEVAQIRGLEFKQAVGVETQSTADFGEYIAGEIDEAVPASIREHYGTIVRTLGLYRGPMIEDFPALMKNVMTSQVGAYYDPARKRFFVVMTAMPDMMQGVLYSHELYHALQDQYFDLDRYMQLSIDRDARGFSADGELARQAVVEGEATYVMTLWMMQKMAGKIPPREVMAQVVGLQANMSLEQINEALKSPDVQKQLGDDLQDAMDSTRDIPPFILDTMMGAYLKGLGFVFAVHEQGWSAVEKLYTEYPPQSTEHILHSEKWLAREAPHAFEWSSFDKLKPLRGWELLDNDVIGEFQWRIIFREHGLTAEADSAAAGWGGDRYAVFKRKDSDATLLLLRTSWDSEADAKEFAAAYRRLLEVKHAAAPTATRVVHKGLDVFVVEGSDESGIDALLKIVRKAKRLKAS